MKALDDGSREALAAALAECGADGWLLFDFQGHNPVANRFLALGGLGSRRIFVYLAPQGDPVAVVHKIELQPLTGFPGRVVPYARREELAAALKEVVAGKTVAMEVSPRDGVPYLDRVPHGIVELIESLGGTDVVEIKCDGALDEVSLSGLAGVHTVKAHAQGLSLTVEHLHKTLPLLLSHLQQTGRTLSGLSTHHATLEDVFVNLTGRHLRD